MIELWRWTRSNRSVEVAGYERKNYVIKLLSMGTHVTSLVYWVFCNFSCYSFLHCLCWIGKQWKSKKTHRASIRTRNSTLTNRHDVGDCRAIWHSYSLIPRPSPSFPSLAVSLTVLQVNGSWVKAWEQGYGIATSILSNWIELILVLK